MHASWQPPQNYRSRPVTVIGAGVLGRRIGCIWASAGYDVRIRDPSAQQRAEGIAYIEENATAYAASTGRTPGKAEGLESLKDAVSNSWLVIEAIPERIELKIDVFGELAALAPSDCVLASNSSSYKSSEMLEKVPDAVKPRILNMHYYMPPRAMIVELMTDGYTAPEIFPFMIDRSKEAATFPYVARKESTGFIFNRLWAAVKRETLTILAEGVSVPEEIDSMWTRMFLENGITPCRMMDDVGLDTVAFIENHYIHERGLSGEKTVDYLTKNYLDQGKLGTKSSKGGLYPVPQAGANEPRLLVLDIGLSAATPDTKAGQILEFTPDGKRHRVLIRNQALPDGLVVDSVTRRMFWTCMGVPGKQDGAVYSSNLDGTDIQTVLSPGSVNTPKQITLDRSARKLYFSDREGMRVYRCNLDGSDLETLISNGDHPDTMQWCVGIAVLPKLGKFYWTQKGYSKSNRGRIFCANIAMPPGQSATTRDDIQCVLSGLPEPIDLEIDAEGGLLYWTDRGELPFGNSLNRARLDLSSGLVVQPPLQQKQHEVIFRNLNEAIGLALDPRDGRVYMTDLGGNIYQCDRDGKQGKKLYTEDSRAFTGIAVL